MSEGKKVKDFQLKGVTPEGEEKDFSLKDLLDKPIVLYFYPKDNTPGCTQEACDFKEALKKIPIKANIVGISSDSLQKHKNFIEKYQLNFPLLSDPQHNVMEQFEVWGEKKMYGKTFKGVIRSTFILNTDSIIVKEWRNVKVKGHIKQVLEELAKLS